MQIVKIVGLRYFNFAGANDFVAFSRAGREVAAGKGLAGVLRQSTAVTVVPLGVKTVQFQVTERSKDKQLLIVTGELLVDYVPEMREQFDFSVYPESGMYRDDPTAQIEDMVRIAVRGPLRNALADLELTEATTSGAAVLETALQTAVADADSALIKSLAATKIAVRSAAVKSVLPADRKVADAVDASEREKLLAAQDNAVAARRKNAAEQDRDIRMYEEATALELVKEQAERVAQEGENLIAVAKSEALATEARLKPYADRDSGELLALAVMKAAEEGIGNISLDPSLLAAVRAAKS